MVITAIPRENFNSVSTRIHYYAYLNNLPDGMTWRRHRGEFGNVLYIQKKADDKTIKIAKKAKLKGVKVVYDCDDNPYERPGKRRITMLRLADAVTTDTKSRADQLYKWSGAKNIHVIPECIDYWNKIQEISIRDNIASAVTFGNNSNAVNTAKYMKYINCECRHINSKKVKGAGKFIKWKYDTFIGNLISSDICILIHGDDLKSNLKLLVCMKVGIPTIVSDTRNYRETYEKIGLGWLVAKNPTDGKSVLDTIESREQRESIKQIYNSYDYSKHVPQYSGWMLGEVFKNG